MRQLSPAEVLSMAKLLEMETQALTLAKTSQMAISDEQLKTAVQSGIAAAEARIAGLQQFILENNVTSAASQSQFSNQQQEGY